MEVTEIQVKNALVRSRIPGVEYVINPYLGCAHGCRYCYAVFMRKYSRHHAQAPWGSFVEVKVNLLTVLRGELKRKKQRGTVMLSSVCDPYQPLEARYRLTRGCLELLREYGWGIEVLTKSPLVTRDLDLLTAPPPAGVGFSIGTDDDKVRRLLEPQAPPMAARVAALKTLAQAGVPTWVFIAPMLPLNPERLVALIAPHASRIMMDRLNYPGPVRQLFYRQGWDYALTEKYAAATAGALRRLSEARKRGDEAPGPAPAQAGG
jgi:DNA repair photolyase